MKIHPKITGEIKKTQEEKRSIEVPQETKKAAGKKVVDLSGDGLLIQKGKDAISAHEAKGQEKVARIREQIQSGSYKIDEDRLAEILEEKL